MRIFFFITTPQKFRAAPRRWTSLINLMRCLFCKGLVTLDEKSAYLMNNNYIHERKIWIPHSLMSRHKISWMVYAVEWGLSAELFYQQKNDKFITREGIRHFTKNALVVILHDYTQGYSKCLNFLFYFYLFLYIFLDTTFVHFEQLWRKNNEPRLLPNMDVNS